MSISHFKNQYSFVYFCSEIKYLDISVQFVGVIHSRAKSLELQFDLESVPYDISDLH